MSGIQTAIQLTDRITAPLQNICASVNLLIGGFENMQYASGNAFDVPTLEAAHQRLAAADAQLNEITQSTDAAERAQNDYNERIHAGTTGADNLMNKVKGFVGAYIGMQTIRQGIDFIQESIAAIDKQMEAETKLAEVMQTRMGANAQMIQSIKDLASAQQGIGVIGDEVQLAGAQQLSTFLNSTSALESLIPAMNNLAVQQNGVSATSENMVNIGNLMGKVMQGQTSALTRVGVTFTEAQEQVLKYGNEQERAAMLAQVITDNVGNMNAVMASTPQGKIQQIKNAWGDIIEQVGAKLYPAVMRFFDCMNENMPNAEALVYGLARVLSVVVDVATVVIDVVAGAAGFIADNWSIIAPIILGVAAAIAAYVLITKGAAIASAVSGAATKAWAAAQKGLNAVMSMNPVGLIIIAVIALVAIIYAVVAAINKTQGTTISATGIIMGVLNSLKQFFLNTFAMIWNVIADFVNFFANVFKNPVASIKILFLDLANSVIGYMLKIGEAIETIINKIPGMQVDITSGVKHIQEIVQSASAKVKSESEWTEVVQKIEYGSYEDAYNKGYKTGEGFENKLTDFMSNGLNGIGTGGYGDSGNQMAEDLANIAGDTGNISDSLDVSSEDLKYIRDIAEQDAINRFTTAEIKVDMTNNNSIKQTADIDGIISDLTSKVYGAMEVVREGA